MKAGTMTLHVALTLSSLVMMGSAALPFGDYPIASCKIWNGTIRKVSGQDSQHALMVGVVTDDDLREYCQRAPGGETIEYGGKLTVEECVKTYRSELKEDRVRSIADCHRGTIVFQGNYGTSSAQFPLGPDEDDSCASGMPPLQAQFRILCPTNAARWGID